MAPTQALARFILDVSLDDLPAAVVDKAKKAITDTVAAILAGAGSELADPLRRYLELASAGGRSPVLGLGLLASPEEAAFVNGTLGHALDFDDVLSIMPAHPSAVILAALFALTPPGTVDGRRLLEAYVAGLEVGARIGLAIGQGHYRRGWHATGTLTVFSAIAALAKLKQLDVETICRAFGIGASKASGIQRNFGTMTKPGHSGMAAQSAVAAVQLAMAGFTAHPEPFLGAQGFFAVYGDQYSDPEKITHGLGNPWVLLEPGLALKKYPCVYAAHRPIDAMLYLRETYGLTPDNVRAIVCHMPPGSLLPFKYTRPETGLQAKFALDYILAAALLDGSFKLWTFSDEAVRRPEIRGLLPRIQAVEDEYCISEDPEAQWRSAGTKGFVEVRVTMADGTVVRRRVDRPVGSPQRELSWDDIQGKFMDCTVYAGLDLQRAGAAFSALRHLEASPDVHHILMLVH